MKANKSEKLNLELIIKAGTEFSKAPWKSENWGDCVCASICIDEDHTATLTMDKETLGILQASRRRRRTK